MSSGSAITEQRDIIKDVHDSTQRALRTTTSGTFNLSIIFSII